MQIKLRTRFPLSNSCACHLPSKAFLFRRQCTYCCGNRNGSNILRHKCSLYEKRKDVDETIGILDVRGKIMERSAPKKCQRKRF